MAEKPKSDGQSATNHRPAGTTLFRALNFELYVKTNKYIMAAGLVAITSCGAYLFYMNRTGRGLTENQYVALNDEGTEYLRERKSKWD